MRRAAVLALLLAACSSGPQTPAPVPQPGPGDPVPAGVDLSGNWFLIEDNAMPMGGMPRGGPGGRPGGGGEPPGGMPGQPTRDSASGEMGGRRGPPREPPPDSVRPTGAAADLIYLERAPLRMVLVQSDTALSIRRNDGMILVLPFDGREIVVERADGRGQLHLAGRWSQRRFEALALLAGGLVYEERFEVSGDGAELTVRSRLHGDRFRNDQSELKRVYRRGNR